MRSLHLLLPLLVAAAMPAQTFVVDASGGPGSSFTSISAAVAAVPNGSTLVVRAGRYGVFDVLGKGLSILGEPGVVIWSVSPGVVGISGQNQNQPVVLRALRFQDVWISLRACLAAVQIEDCAPSSFNQLLGLSIDQCPQVHVGRCSFDDNFSGASGSFTASDVVCVETSFMTQSANPGLRITGGLTQLARCSILGGSGSNGAGIALQNGSLRVLGGSVGSRTVSTPAIAGNGSVRLNWNTVAVSGGPPAPGIVVVPVDDADTAASAASVGGSATGTVEALSGHAGALLFGLPAPPLAMPGIAEELWLELPTAQMVAIGTVNGLTPVTLTIAVPANAALRGATFGWQGITLDPARGLVLANPAWFTLM